MKPNQIGFIMLLLGLSLTAAVAQTNSLQLPLIAAGPFKPDWNSLTNYQTPEWFRDAKFGVWAHWGAQCEPEHGDWYARHMYEQSHADYKSHLVEYGHPSTNGFKDVIHVWKAAHFDPDTLVKFYKDNGAKYFMALANHHDNLDLWNSTYQPWNSVAVGPHKDLIGGWEAAARKNGLRFAVSVHAGRAWSWYATAQGADTNGPLAGGHGESPAGNSANRLDKIGGVKLVRGDRWVGDESLKFSRDEDGLHIALLERFEGKTAFALKIES